MYSITDSQFAGMNEQQRADVMTELHEAHMDMCASFLNDYQHVHPCRSVEIEEYLNQRKAECDVYCDNRKQWVHFLELQKRFPPVREWDPKHAERVKALRDKLEARIAARRAAAAS